MIDTVRFRQEHITLDEPIIGRVPGWKSKRSESDQENESGKTYLRSTSSFSHKLTGIRISGTPSPNFVQASLSRIVFGNNARLITTQLEIDRALAALSDHTSVFGEPDYISQFCRVDLVWHFSGRIADYISAHSRCRHPKIRSAPCIYQGESINWYGKELAIRMYDKRLKERDALGKVVRVEVQLQGKRLQEMLGEGKPVVALNIETCYRAYRKIILGFDQEPDRILEEMDWPMALSLAQKHGWTDNGIPLWDLYARGRSEATVRRVAKQVAALRPTYHEIDWKKLLPEHGLPPVYEINLSGV